MIFPELFFFRQETAAHRRLYAEQLKEIRTDIKSGDALRLPVTGEIDLVPLRRAQSFEGSGLSFPVEIRGRRDGNHERAFLRTEVRHRHDAAGILERNGMQQESF